MFADTLFGIFGEFIGYFSIAIAAFAIAYVIAKTINKKWPYKVALIFSAVLYSMLLIGYLHNKGFIE